MTTDKRINAYIAKAAPFARPILTHIRALVRKGCPDVDETMKWSFPHFDYKGMMCSMAAFKAHCAMGFWKASLLPDSLKLQKVGREAMGHLGRITSLEDLPPDRVLLTWIRRAAALNNEGRTIPRKTKAVPKPPPRPPAWFMAALRKHPAALKNFRVFSPSHKREYLEWVVEAKTDETRARRLALTVEWLSQGKSRNWKYQRKK